MHPPTRIRFDFNASDWRKEPRRRQTEHDVSPGSAVGIILSQDVSVAAFQHVDQESGELLDLH